MKGYIVLSTGETFEGELLGNVEQVYGEVVFFTGMTGYEEVITDPSFKGQMVVFTYPLIGNYGINGIDQESVGPQASALIMQGCRSQGYHYEAIDSLKEYAEKHSLPILVGVDTRAVVKRIRELGDMGAIITTNLDSVDFSSKQTIGTRDLVQEVSTTTIESFGDGDHHVVMVDFGYKKSIVTSLMKLGCKVTVVPYNTDELTIANLGPDGILFSNGPGNPKKLLHLTGQIKRLATTYPTMGICLGHQLLALAFGGDTEKLRFGHRGANQPVQDLLTKKVYITSQNHSYVVTDSSLKETGFTPRYVNINDRSIEGMSHSKYPITSVQFHPEAHPGPSDSEEIFLHFLTDMSSKRREKVYA
ncbi:carbamoyl phosphate synthase small subunit [Anaerobacillus alkalilacustris]|uniref:Carbamoyl phosphate synthase small chain n=1 Tax=Anaerobacillus alkalilacustris TaxID=393763 RepID=A0A1S2LDA7_9BACI|nr:carbamoyl phosphate synthase small subunit [Anaerobacillus alkalilacustris]OIJ10472.1 carbamoyl phosphate synthase small subunit [Anaerobacillus alkalilacustris]